MQVSTKYFAKTFKDADSKEAYLKAMRWYATNVVSDDILKETFLKVVKGKEGFLQTITIELYATIDDEEHRKKFCDRCQEFHKLFYINQQYNCDKCNMMANKSQIEAKLAIKKDYRKGILKKKLLE
jgi:hypothetical protein